MNEAMTPMTEVRKTLIEVRESGAGSGRAALRIEGDIVASRTSGIREEIKALLARGVTVLVLNFEAVHMVDSAGIGLLISAHNSLRKAGGALELTHVAPDIGDLFRTMRLHKHVLISVAG